MTAPRQHRLAPGLAMAIVGAICFAGKAIIVKLSYRYGVDAITVIMLRMLFAFPIFVAMAWWAGRDKAPLAARDWAIVLGLGFIGYYLSSFLDFLGLQYITASLERLITYLTPTLVMVLAWLTTRKPWQRAQVAAMAISYAGALLVFGHENTVSGSNVMLGAALVFASTCTYAIYMVCSGQLVQRLGSLRLVGLASSFACVCAVGQYFALRPWAEFQAVPGPVFALAAFNAVFCTVVPVLLIMMAIERIGPTLAAQSGMVGPLATIFMGVWLLGEPFTVWIAAGTALVVAGIFVFSRGAKR